MSQPRAEQFHSTADTPQPAGDTPHPDDSGIRCEPSFARDSRLLASLLTKLPTDETTSVPPPVAITSGALSNLEEIGRGGLGIVYRCWDDTLKRHVALKVAQFKTLRNPTGLARFLREREIVACLQHPGVPQVYQCGYLPDERPFYVMRLVVGETLTTSIQRIPRTSVTDFQSGKAAALVELLEAFRKLCDTIHEAHQPAASPTSKHTANLTATRAGILHRDLKPDNVMLEGSGALFVLDWGLARALTDSEIRSQEHPSATEAAIDSDILTHDGQRLGSLPWMSPEQAAGRTEEHSIQTDVYGLGAILFQILTGSPPHAVSEQDGQLPLAIRLHKIIYEEVPDCRTVCPFVPAELASICERALQLSPTERYPSARELSEDVTAWLRGAPVTAHHGRYSRRELIGRAIVQRKQLAGTIAIAGLVVMVVTTTAAMIILNYAQRTSQALGRQRQANSQLFNALEEFTSTVMTDSVLSSPLLSEVREDLLTQLGVQYQLWSAQQLDGTDDEKVRAARGLTTVSSIEVQTGNLERARTTLRTSLNLWRAAVRRDNSSTALRGLLEGLRLQAGLQLADGQLEEAEASCAECRDLLEQKRSLLNQQTEWSEESELNRVLSNLEYSRAERRSVKSERYADFHRSRAYAEGQVEFLRKLVEREPTTKNRLDLVAGMTRIALTTQKAGNPLGAVPIYEKTLDLLTVTLSENLSPVEATQIRAQRMSVLFSSVMAHNGALDYPSARRASLEGIAIASELEQRYPLVIRYRQEHARGWGNYASALFADEFYSGDQSLLEFMVEAHQKAADLYLQLDAQLPDRGYRGEAAVHLVRYGYSLLRADQIDRARDAFRRGLAMVPDFPGIEPTNAGNWYWAAIGYATLLQDPELHSDTLRQQYEQQLRLLSEQLAEPAVRDRYLLTQLKSGFVLDQFLHLSEVAELLRVARAAPAIAVPSPREPQSSPNHQR